MGMPTWWNERRLGLFVHANLATVPAWAPIGEDSDWYRSHLGEDVADVVAHPRPLVEVLAHHRDRWGHIERFDDFLPLLTFDAFDAEAWARLAIEAGAGYSVLVAKHHDGWAWWDAPNTDRTMLIDGPSRNVLAEYASACERNGVVFGTYYSSLDWGDARYPGQSYVDSVLHPHVLDLVERFGSSLLWGDGQWGQGADHWRSAELLERVRAIDPDIVVNDRWSVTHLPDGGNSVVTTFDHQPPPGIVEGPWELRRAIGASSGHNRAERAEHHLSAFDIVALYTEVVAKGGHLLLSVGPAADGSIPELQAAPLRASGSWIRRLGPLLGASIPWSVWGDDHTRFYDVAGQLYAIDLRGRGHFRAVRTDRWTVVAVEVVDDTDPAGAGTPVSFTHDDEGLHLDVRRSRLDRHDPVVSDVSVYRIGIRPVDRPVGLFEPAPRQAIELAPLMRDVSPGDIVQLGDGTYTGPITVPAGVVVRGLGPSRTRISGGGLTAVNLERNARLEHLTVDGGSVDGGPQRIAGSPSPTVEVHGPYATILGCRVEGHVVVRSDDVLVKATTAFGVVADGGERLTVSRCDLNGMRWDVGIHLIGGSGHEIDSCDLHDHVCAIRASDTTATIVRGNNITARWWGIHLERTERAHVHGNFVNHTMRGVDIEGGTQAVIDGNAVCDGDSGCIVEWGAAEATISGNRWERCRIGVLAWAADNVRLHANEAIDLHEPDGAITTGP